MIYLNMNCLVALGVCVTMNSQLGLAPTKSSQGRHVEAARMSLALYKYRSAHLSANARTMGTIDLLWFTTLAKKWMTINLLLSVHARRAIVCNVSKEMNDY